MILKLEKIDFIAENEKILDNVNLEIEKGDMVSIVGTSGSGKSTLLKLCSDLISPSNGSLYFNDKSYKNYDPIQLRQKISYCVQIPYLFGDTVYDNLSYPFKIRKEKVDLEIIKEFMKKFNLEEDYINKDINLLSGGEKQRVALIRNLIFKPEVLLLDEVTASLDPENTTVVENIIKEMNSEGVTVVWITHDINQSNSIFNKKITIENGKIANSEVFN